jgi:N-hydroxyarylamine O-acetyltransferase
MTPAELAAYFDRIGFAGPTTPRPETLTALQRAHRRAIPFENLDIPLGRGISLAPEAIFAKLVTARRGGYCFEQNGLFLAVLKALGFAAGPLLARVWLSATPENVPARSHTLILVEAAGRAWISDVGFGGAIALLLPLARGRVTDEDGVRHSLDPDPDHGWMLRRNGAPQYSFTDAPVWPADLVQANHFAATAPQSRFTRVVVVSRPMPEGLATLTDLRLSEPAGEAAVADAASYRAILAERFGLRLSAPDVLRLGLFGPDGAAAR